MKAIGLFNAYEALFKLFEYGYLPISQVFCLSVKKTEILNVLKSYEDSRNGLLAKYGESEGGGKYSVVGEENIAEYTKELEELESQEIDLEIPKEKLFLCVESIEKIDKELTVEKQLGFSANDWIAIREIITVIEKEE